MNIRLELSLLKRLEVERCMLHIMDNVRYIITDISTSESI